MKKKITFTLLLTLMIAGLSSTLISCYTPNPLYGTWSDNDANTITFLPDGTFTAKINNSSGESVEYQGNYSVIDNTIMFSITGDKEYTRLTEWDIRGAMLYLTWTANNKTRSITLYHVSR